ncbi:MAG TPA: AraC family transcriptional regulator [Pseudonocardiaceae bacterium]|nr:AraC family transcriptional regulator [Pseudonocardiaceae bacterium]
MLMAVEKAISSIHERYDGPITLNELAAEVYVSPFHFSRMFARITGVTPGRYLTAVRLFEAKRLLLTTSMTVSDIVCTVGYSSVGTFTSRFTRAVGMTPTQYRDPAVADLLIALSPTYQRIPSFDAITAAGIDCAKPQQSGGALLGQLELPEGRRWRTLVGVFADPVPQAGPVAFSALTHTGSTELIINNIPRGEWTVIAAAESVGDPAVPADFMIGTVRTPLTVTHDETVTVDIAMRTRRPADPPIAITLASGIAAVRGDSVRTLHALPQAA